MWVHRVMISQRIMFLFLLLLGSAISTPADEFGEIINHGVGDFSQKDGISNIVPGSIILAQNGPQSRYSTSHVDNVVNDVVNDDVDEWSKLIQQNRGNHYFEPFNQHIVKGNTARDLTFCIYDDNMREAAISLFRLFQNTAGETFARVRNWAKQNVNIEMYMYALRLESLYSSKTNESTLLPPFVWNPYYFVNAESISKASLAIEEAISNPIDPDGMVTKKMSDIYPNNKIKELIVIKSNYSGWNNGNEDLLNYFREDISLDSYYLGIHLLHPFWMSNDELENLNPRFAEHYYYAHQQLMARLNLEKLHINKKDSSKKYDNWKYVPYIRYKNGLAFPPRSCMLGEWNDEKAYMKTIDIALRECISRGLVIMQDGQRLKMADDSHINILAKLIRANLDGIKFAKIARSVVGYRGNAKPIDEYDPAPSILHHPETTLKDPAYWVMIQYMLNYFTDYKNTMEPFDMSQYESDEFVIVNGDFSKLTTYFDYYQFPINLALSNYIRNEDDWIAYLEVRQRRLKHAAFSFNFTVDSKVDKDTVIRLYLGPECGVDTCWDQYNNFFELDTFSFTLKKGNNDISWSPESSNRFSFDEYFNTPLPNAKPATKYSIFRFPENLLIPRGLEEGLNLTLFVMITPDDDFKEIPDTESFYRKVSTELDSKPLGFPFHRQAKGFKDTAFNYKFYNISIFHKSQAVDHRGYFSPHLY